MKLRKVILVAGLVVAVGVGAFTIVYATRGSDAVSQAQAPIEPPAKDVTPPPGGTPDTSKPFWHIPYINQDEKRPIFVGTLNGYTIDPAAPERSAYDVCPGVGLDQAYPSTADGLVAAPGPLRIDPSSLPALLGEMTRTDAWACKGNLTMVSRSFRLKPGAEGVNEGGGSLQIFRAIGNDPVGWAAPQERWNAIQVNGLPAVVSRPIVSVGTKQFGDCFVAVYEPRTDVKTTVWGAAANESVCLAVAEAVIQ